MDRSWYENNGGECAGAAAMEECSYRADLDLQATCLSSEFDDQTLLMELLKDLQPSSDQVDGGDVDRLSHVIRSLEAEIGGSGSAAVMVDDNGSTAVGPWSEEEDGGSRLVDDMLLDLGGYESASFGYWPTEDCWYLYADECEGGVIGYYEGMDHQYQYVESCCADQMYSPLWT